MRRVRRNGGVAAGCGLSFGGERRRVVDVDQVVRDTGVVGVADGHWLEDRGRLAVGGKGLLGLGLRAGEVERAEDLRLVVVRVACGQRRERLGPALLTCLFRPGREVTIVCTHRLDVVAFALGSGTDAAALFKCRLRALGFAWPGANAGEGIVHQDGGDAPSGDAAGRILHQHVTERWLGGAVPE